MFETLRGTLTACHQRTRGRRPRAYQSQLEHDLPDPEVVEPPLTPHLVEERVQAALVAVLGLDVQVPVGLPAVEEAQRVRWRGRVAAAQLAQHLDFLQLAAAVARPDEGVARPLDRPDLLASRPVAGGRARQPSADGPCLRRRWRKVALLSLGGGDAASCDPKDLRELAVADELDAVEARGEAGVDVDGLRVAVVVLGRDGDVDGAEAAQRVAGRRGRGGEEERRCLQRGVVPGQTGREVALQAWSRNRKAARIGGRHGLAGCLRSPPTVTLDDGARWRKGARFSNSVPSIHDGDRKGLPWHR